MAPPMPKTKSLDCHAIVLRLQPEMYERVKLRAEQEHRPVASQVAFMVACYFAKLEHDA